MKNLFQKLIDLYFSISDFISYPVYNDNVFIRYFMRLVKLVIILIFGIIVLVLLFISVLVLVFIVSYIEKQFSYNINTETCEPIGIYSNYQFNYNPLDFYNNQINSIEEMLRYSTFSSIKSHCISSDDNCIERMNKYNQEMSLCLLKYKKEYKNTLSSLKNNK